MSLNQFPRRSFVGSSTIQTFTGNGSQTTYTLSSAQTQNECFIFVDDVVQVPGVDFTVNGTTLTFTVAPLNTAEIIVRGFGVPAPVTTVSDGSVTAVKLATGAIEAKLGYTPASAATVASQLATLVDSAPSTLDTLNELAAALGDDANFATTITTTLALKVGIDSSTGAATLPVGTTAQRPTGVTGMIRYNTTDSVIETYNGTLWMAVGDQSVPYTVESLVIAGGGGGGSNYTVYDAGGGGGGAGGYRSSVVGESSGGGGPAESVTTLTPRTVYTVTIGAGGAGAITNAGGKGANGSNSTFDTITSIGGGGGGTSANNSLPDQAAGASGGSGGGATTWQSTNRSGGSGTTNQGYAGGNTNFTGTDYAGAGGGGAGAVGSSNINDAGGFGGNGVSSSINGTTTTRAGGGGGGYRSGSGSNGGTGGGGAGGAGGNGTSGIVNTGSGGGGSAGTPSNGAAGGSGIVIIRYLGAQKGLGGTVTQASGYTIHTFTSSGTYTA